MSCQKFDWPLHRTHCQPQTSSFETKTKDDIKEQTKETPTYTYYDSLGRPVKTPYSTEYTQHPPDTEISVKAGSQKLKLYVNPEWSGEFTLKYLSSHTRIALDEMRVIIKGKVHTAESVSTALTNKTLVMVLGTPVVDSTGVDERDIECLMRQMDIDRNKAITSLKKTNSLVDSIVDIGNS